MEDAGLVQRTEGTSWVLRVVVIVLNVKLILNLKSAVLSQTVTVIT
jgi:hypothetical protein